MTVQLLKVHLGANELRQVIMSSIPGAFNPQAEFTTVQTVQLITPACGYVRWAIEQLERADRDVLGSGTMFFIFSSRPTLSSCKLQVCPHMH